MNVDRLVLITVACGLASACQFSNPPARLSPVTTTPTIFTDSVLHAQSCMSLMSGEDWHRVCTLRFQGVRVF